MKFPSLEFVQALQERMNGDAAFHTAMPGSLQSDPFLIVEGDRAKDLTKWEIHLSLQVPLVSCGTALTNLTIPANEHDRDALRRDLSCTTEVVQRIIGSLLVSSQYPARILSLSIPGLAALPLVSSAPLSLATVSGVARPILSRSSSRTTRTPLSEVSTAVARHSRTSIRSEPYCIDQDSG